MDALHRIFTGQTLTPRQLRIAGFVVLAWIAIDVIQFGDWLWSKMPAATETRANDYLPALSAVDFPKQCVPGFSMRPDGTCRSEERPSRLPDGTIAAGCVDMNDEGLLISVPCRGNPCVLFKGALLICGEVMQRLIPVFQTAPETPSANPP